MILLIVFAFVAGAGTALTPCVLPVLPAALSAGITGARRRPFGVATGLALSFTFATVGLVYVIDALGLPSDLARNLAIAVLLVFGVSLLVPPLSDRVEALISRVVPAPPAGGDGFRGGLLLGVSLGFVYAPCAGPILAGVITASASQPFTAQKLAVAFAYAVGSAVVIYAILIGGRRLANRLTPIKGRINYVMGAVMIAVGLILITNTDISFESALARDAPSFLINPTKSIEDSSSVKGEIASLRGGGKSSQQAGTSEANAGKPLPVIGPAPDFTDTQQWFNTPGGTPLSLAALRGKVVLVDFWTYSCINCLRTLPYVEAWYRKYQAAGFVVVGVHTPEFPFEREASNVSSAISANGLTYPVVQDNSYGTWDAYGNQYWPAKYLIDAAGQVRYVHFGEGNYGTTEAAIRSLLAERGSASLGSDVRVSAQSPSLGLTTPESYLGGARAERVVDGPLLPGTHSYGRGAGQPLPADHLAYGGTWQVSAESATAVKNAQIELNFNARRVFLVLGSPAAPLPLRVLLDGKPLPDGLAGADVSRGVARVQAQRLYRLVDLPRVERHTLSLRFAPGISGYAFTFG